MKVEVPYLLQSTLSIIISSYYSCNNYIWVNLTAGLHVPLQLYRVSTNNVGCSESTPFGLTMTVDLNIMNEGILLAAADMVLIVVRLSLLLGLNTTLLLRALFLTDNTYFGVN